MFAATMDEDGTYRLSIRRIRTIRQFTNYLGQPEQIRFRSRARAKECADELNEKTKYEIYFDRKTGEAFKPGPETDYQMGLVLSIISKYRGNASGRTIPEPSREQPWVAVGDITVMMNTPQIQAIDLSSN